MKNLADDRRTTRSSDTATALQFLLHSQQSKGALDSVALATEEGLLLAGVGQDAEMLGAIAPILARGKSLKGISPSDTKGVSVHAFLVGGREFYLAMRGPDGTSAQSEKPLTPRAQLALSGMQAATRILRS